MHSPVHVIGGWAGALDIIGTVTLATDPTEAAAEIRARLRLEERWCNEVAAEVLVPLSDLAREYRGPAEEAELSGLARHFTVSTLVVFTRLHEAGQLSWEEYRSRYAVESERVIALARERKAEPGACDEPWASMRETAAPAAVVYRGGDTVSLRSP